jgi:hypothetical protein
VDVSDARHDQAVALLTSGEKQITLEVYRENLVVNHLPPSPNPLTNTQPMKSPMIPPVKSIEPSQPVQRVQIESVHLDQSKVEGQAVTLQYPQTPPVSAFQGSTVAVLKPGPVLSPPDSVNKKITNSTGHLQQSDRNNVANHRDNTIETPAPRADSSSNIHMQTGKTANARSAFFSSTLQPQQSQSLSSVNSAKLSSVSSLNSTGDNSKLSAGSQGQITPSVQGDVKKSSPEPYSIEVHENT